MSAALAEDRLAAASAERACAAQAGRVGLGEAIRGSLSAELGPVLIGVLSHAGSPRPESPTRQGSVAHIGREALALQQQTSAQQASYLLLPCPMHVAAMLKIRLLEFSGPSERHAGYVCQAICETA